MKNKVMLPIASLFTLLLLTFHLTDDILRGMAPGGLVNVAVMLVMAAWLHATLVLAGRRSGQIFVLVLSLLGSGIPVLHTSGAGLGSSPRQGGFFFVWTLIALGASALFSAALAVRGLRSPSA